MMRSQWILFAYSLSGCGLDPLAGDVVQDSEDETLSLSGLEASSTFIDFGSVSVGETVYQDLVLTNRSTDILVIAEAVINGDLPFVIDTMTALPANVGDGFSEIITLAFTPDDELDYSAALHIQLDSNTETMALDLLGSGEAEEAGGGGESATSLAIDISSIDFGEVDTYSESMEQVTITNEGTDDVLIRNITTNDSYYSYSGDMVPPTVMSSGISKIFYVVFTPQTVGDFPATITVETDIDDGMVDFEIQVNGSAVEPDCEVCSPQIQVNTPTGDNHLMNFLSVYNLPDEQLLSIQNLSDVEMTISDAYLSNDSQGGSFRVSFSPITLGPWETASAAVSFTCPEFCFEYPNPLGDTNILHILSDDPSEPDYQIELWTGF